MNAGPLTGERLDAILIHILQPNVDRVVRAKVPNALRRLPDQVPRPVRIGILHARRPERRLLARARLLRSRVERRDPPGRVRVERDEVVRARELLCFRGGERGEALAQRRAHRRVVRAVHERGDLPELERVVALDGGAVRGGGRVHRHPGALCASIISIAWTALGES